MIDERGLAEIVKAAWREARGPLVGASDGQTYVVPALTNDLMRDICRAAIAAYLSASAEPVVTNPDVMFGRETVTRLAKQLGVEDSPTTVFKAALAMARETRDGALVLPPLDPEPPMSDITEEEIARAPVYDGSIEVRLDDKGGVDEIVGLGVICHIERLSNGTWFVSLTRPDQTEEAFWLAGKGSVDVCHTEHRTAPTTGPNAKPWTLAAAIRKG